MTTGDSTSDCSTKEQSSSTCQMSHGNGTTGDLVLSQGPETPRACRTDGRDEFTFYKTPALKQIVPVQVLVPSIPVRIEQLARALNSVERQTVACEVIVRLDKDREGAAANRNKLLNFADRGFVAFLDDDDELYPEHIEKLYQLIVTEKADVAYSIPRIVNQNGDEINAWQEFHVKDFAFNPDTLLEKNYIPVTVMARREALVKVGGFEHLKGIYGEDHGLWLKLLYAGAKFVHLPEQTWQYNWWGHGRPGQPGNTSGIPGRW